MNFTITITGEKKDLADSLAILKAVMGEQVGSGSVQAVVTPAPAAPIQQQPQYQQPQQPAAVVPSQQYQAPQQHQAPFQQTAPVQQAVVPQAVPVAAAPSYTTEQLGVAAGPIVDAGRAPELTAWINQRGATALNQLDKAHYGEFATYLRSLGAKI